MKRFITLCLMLTTLFTFTGKLMALTSVAESEKSSMANCDMSEMSMQHGNNNGCMSESSDFMPAQCQDDCQMMTVVSLLYFIENEQCLVFSSSQIRYPHLSTNPPFYFSETLYRPPFLS